MVEGWERKKRFGEKEFECKFIVCCPLFVVIDCHIMSVDNGILTIYTDEI